MRPENEMQRRKAFMQYRQIGSLPPPLYMNDQTIPPNRSANGELDQNKTGCPFRQPVRFRMILFYASSIRLSLNSSTASNPPGFLRLSSFFGGGGFCLPGLITGGGCFGGGFFGSWPRCAIEATDKPPTRTNANKIFINTFLTFGFPLR